MFPNLKPGKAKQYLTTTLEDVKLLTQNKEFIRMMEYGFQLILEFYGLKYSNGKIEFSMKNDFYGNGLQRYTTYFVQGGFTKHNHPRITRIISSLRLFELDEQYETFHEFALMTADRYDKHISPKTKQFWKNA